MAIPLVPLFAGAVIGGLVTYIYKDEKARSAMSRTADDVTDKVKGTASSISGKVSDSVGGIKSKFSKKPTEEETERSDTEAMVAEDLADSDDLELHSSVSDDLDSEIEQGEPIDQDKPEDK